MEQPEANAAVYANRRRIKGKRRRALMRKRGELVERTFAHLYETGGMRRTHLREHENILKRLLIHSAGFNLSLLLRKAMGTGTARGMQDRAKAVLRTIFSIWSRLRRSTAAFTREYTRVRAWFTQALQPFTTSKLRPLTTGC